MPTLGIFHSIMLLILLILSATPARAQNFQRLVMAPGVESLRVQDAVYYLDNRITRFSADDILAGKADSSFIKVPRMPYFFGLIKEHWAGAFWVRIEIDNQGTDDLLLLTDYNASPTVHRMISLDEAGRILRTRTFDEDLLRTQRVYSISPGIQTVFFEIRPDGFAIPMTEFEIKTPQSLHSHRTESVVLAISCGIAIALSLYNLILAFVLRTRSHWIYVGYNLGLILYYEGRYQLFAEQFGIPELPLWSLVTINSSASLFFVLFLYHMMDVPQRLPGWKWPLRMTIGSLLAISAWSFHDRQTAQFALILVLAFSGPLTLVLAVHAVLKKVPASHLLMISSILPGIGNFIHFWPQLFITIFPISFIKISQMVFMDIEMILLSMTIAYKLNQEREWLRKKIENGYSELKTIVYPHQVDMIWEGQSLPQTMPLGEANAYVLVFDVVASSKMSIKNPRKFLSEVFSECYSIMMENYKEEPLEANAFRIKEMGDGFICSIGFPFACPSARPADHSVELAFRFVEVFKRHWHALGVGEPLHCAIGLAHGPVEAFFPESGVKVYELFGRGIILAHRYEAMRDLLFRKLGQQGHIIILSKKVYSQLTSQVQTRFTELELTTAGFHVRDDEDADRLYFRVDEGEALSIAVKETA